MGIIQQLRSEGVLKLFLDFRSGSVSDLSGNGVTSTIVGSPAFRKNGLLFNGSTDAINLTSMGISAGGARTVFVRYTPAPVQVNTAHSCLFIQGASLDWQHWTVDIQETADDIDTGFYAHDYSIARVSGRSPRSYASTLDGTSLKMYQNASHISTQTAASVNTSDANWSIGRNKLTNTNYYTGIIESVVIVSRALTATEITSLEAELEATTWPSKTTSKAKADTAIDVNEPGLVAAYDMKPVNGQLVDLSPEGNDSTTNSRTASEKNKVFGDTLKFNQTDGSLVLVPVGTLPVGASARTWAITVKSTDADVAGEYFMTQGDASATREAFFIGYNANQFYLSVYAEAQLFGAIEDNVWSRVVVTYDGSTTVKCYQDGVLEETLSLGGTLNTGSHSLNFGGLRGVADFDGWIADAQVYNVVKSAEWVKSEYDRIKNSGVSFKTAQANESIAAEGGTIESYLSNTPFQFGDASARYKVSTASIEGKDCKVIECTTAGALYAKNELIANNTTEGAYGEWDFYMLKDSGGATSPSVTFAANAKTGYGYSVYFHTDEAIKVYSSYDGSSLMSSAAGYVSVNTWHRVKVTRTSAGVISIYLNDTLVPANSGANPSTSTTQTHSNYLVINLDAGDKIALSSPNSLYKRSLA